MPPTHLLSGRSSKMWVRLWTCCTLIVLEPALAGEGSSPQHLLLHYFLFWWKQFAHVISVGVEMCWSNPLGGKQSRMAWLQKRNRADWLWWLPQRRLAPVFAVLCKLCSSALKNVIRHKERHTCVSSLTQPFRPHLLSSFASMGTLIAPKIDKNSKKSVKPILTDHR